MLRSIVMIGAGNAGLDGALDSAADAVLLTLNDSGVPVEQARKDAVAALGRIRERGKTSLVTVNHPRTQLLRGDLEAVVTDALDGVLLAHAVEPQDVRDIGVLLREFEHGRGIEPGTVRLYPVIDSARGLLRAAEIAQAAPRVAGLVFDAHGYARDVQARAEEQGPRLAYARGQVVATARAFDQLPLVMAGSLQGRTLAQYGFAGAIVPDAGGVTATNAAFTPAAAVVERARAAIAAYEAAKGDGAWVSRMGTEVVDSHTVRKARQRLE